MVKWIQTKPPSKKGPPVHQSRRSTSMLASVCSTIDHALLGAVPTLIDSAPTVAIAGCLVTPRRLTSRPCAICRQRAAGYEEIWRPRPGSFPDAGPLREKRHPGRHQRHLRPREAGLYRHGFLQLTTAVSKWSRYIYIVARGNSAFSRYRGKKCSLLLCHKLLRSSRINKTRKTNNKNELCWLWGLPFYFNVNASNAKWNNKNKQWHFTSLNTKCHNQPHKRHKNNTNKAITGLTAI